MAVSDIELNNLILYVAQISVIGGEMFFFWTYYCTEKQ